MKKSTQPPKPKRYTLKELVDQCDSNAPMPKAIQDWDRTSSVGMEQEVMGDILDIEQAVVRFGRQVAKHYEVTQLILIGSRARGDYHAESDADVAVIIKGSAGDFVETKLELAGMAYDNLLETGVLIQALPVWESEWSRPDHYDSPELLRNIAREGTPILF